MWEETYVNARSEPMWTLDTAELAPGWHTYFCQLHPWMRGSFIVE
jgi:plastocyanin